MRMRVRQLKQRKEPMSSLRRFCPHRSAWAALAIYYSNLPWTELRLALAVAFAVFAI